MKAFWDYILKLLIPFVILMVLGFVVGMTFNYFGASVEDMENVISLFPITLCSIIILGFNVVYLRKKSILRDNSIPFWVYLRVLGQLGVVSSLISFYYLLFKYDIEIWYAMDYKVYDLFIGKYLFVSGTILMFSSEVLRYLELIAHKLKNDKNS